LAAELGALRNSILRIKAEYTTLEKEWLTALQKQISPFLVLGEGELMTDTVNHLKKIFNNFFNDFHFRIFGTVLCK